MVVMTVDKPELRAAVLIGPGRGKPKVSCQRHSPRDRSRRWSRRAEDAGGSLGRVVQQLTAACSVLSGNG